MIYEFAKKLKDALINLSVKTKRKLKRKLNRSDKKGKQAAANIEADNLSHTHRLKGNLAGTTSSHITPSGNPNVTSDTIKLNKESVDIVSLINQVVEINTPLAKKKNQKIIFTYPNTDCVILSDHNKLYQAINNIVGNAIKFSPFDKNIWIAVTKEENIKIIIKDEGPGFKKDEVGDVLIKFGKHSATPTGDEISTGLGLLITKQIINLSKGKIYLESEEGKGATFTLEFAGDKLN